MDEFIELTTVGEMLQEDLEAINFTAYKLSQETGLSRSTLSRIISGEKRMTLKTSMLLGKFFDISEDYWFNLQLEYDKQVLREELKSELDAVRSYKALAV